MRTYRWPECPELPPLCEPVLIRMTAPRLRQTARQEARAVLKEVLSAWSGLPSWQLPLQETSCGPIWRYKLAGDTLDISLSYGAGEAWIGLIRGGRIGVDVMWIEPFDELHAVARDYLGSETTTAIAQANDPAHAFAAAWTKREAQIKCMRQPLGEWKDHDVHVSMISELQGDRWFGAIAVS